MRKIDVKEKARERELRILGQWKERDTFRQSIEAKVGKPSFVFYEGPPTANGKPHIGHVLGRMLKDFIARYKTMTGYQVLRKAGWDTHGLPVELGVEKQLGISGKQEIENYGVEKFIEKCKSSVFEYEEQWRELTEAIGYWTDMDDPYITLENNYIESVWNILSHVHKKDLLYKGHRVSPYCPSCQTTLSSHEVAQGYEDVKDLSVTAKFKNKETGEFFLAWTTTPWTLPANVGLAVHAELDYVKVKQGDGVYIVAKNLVEKVVEGDYEILSTHKGSEFVGMTYESPFSFVPLEKGHIVIDADFVSDTSGTGIVHISPAHGEDDYRVARLAGLSMLTVVDLSGKYTEEVTPFAGRFVKDCDVDIVKDLAARDLLYSKEKFEHSYPFCWRCKTPLLYYAMESWFIKTTAIKDQLIANNNSVEWYPGHVKEGRFGKFLEDLVDWNISRNRYWGTPLNVWVCQDCNEEYAPGSIAELRNRAVGTVDEHIELHKPYVDEVQLSCSSCSGTMVRTPEVIDVWFDSGSMPFAQWHYPFENETMFNQQYPADMICEGIDQTRGWFYSLLAVSTLFTGKAPYKRVMATGFVLDEDGQKMSKSKGNVVDPWEIIEEFGADAFRWALISDSVPWNSKRFSRTIMAEAKSKVIDTLMNTHAFYTLYATIDQYKPDDYSREKSDSMLDNWVLSKLNSTIKVVTNGLEGYDFTNPARAIEGFIDDLSNWYIRRSRDRFWGSEMTKDKVTAYQTLHEVLVTLSRLLAPFIPFIAEDLYGNLGGEGSVHLTDYPQANEAAIDLTLEEEMEKVLNIVELARAVRNETAIKTRQPLSELIVSMDTDRSLGQYEDIIKEEINVKSVRYEQSDSGFVNLSLKLNLKVAGPLYGKNVGAIQNYLKQLSAEEVKAIVLNESVNFESATGETFLISKDHLLIEKTAKSGFSSASNQHLTVALDTTITEELKQEGVVREVVRAVQDYRKKLDLPVEKRVDITFNVDNETKEAMVRFDQLLRDSILVSDISYSSHEKMEFVTAGEIQIGMYIA